MDEVNNVNNKVNNSISNKTKYKVDCLILDFNTNNINLIFSFYTNTNNNNNKDISNNNYVITKEFNNINLNDLSSLKGEFINFLNDNNIINYDKRVHLYYLNDKSYYEVSHLPSSLPKSKLAKVIENNLKDTFTDEYKDEGKSDTSLIRFKNKRLISVTYLIKKDLLNKYKKVLTSLSLLVNFNNTKDLALVLLNKLNNNNVNKSKVKDNNGNYIYLLSILDNKYLISYYYIEKHYIRYKAFINNNDYNDNNLLINNILLDINSFNYKIDRLFNNNVISTIYIDGRDNLITSKLKEVNNLDVISINLISDSFSFPIEKESFLNKLFIRSNSNNKDKEDIDNSNNTNNKKKGLFGKNKDEKK